MKALFVLAMAALTTLGAAWPRPAGGPPPSPLLRRALLLVPALLGLAVALAALGVGPRWPVPGDVVGLGDSWQRYHVLLCRVPVAVQGALGLLLLLVPSVVTARLFVAQLPRRVVLAALAVLPVWAAIYQWLPFHLSAPDYDDFYVFDKFLCAVDPTWTSNKPPFTLYDYLFRVLDLTGTSDPTRRFAVGGWLWVLFQANTLLLVRRVLAGRGERALGAAAAVVGSLAVAASGPALVLATTLDYELAGAVLLLTSFNFVEGVADGTLFPRHRAAALLAWCSAGLVAATYSHNQMCVMWVAVLLHAALALHALREDRSLAVLAPLLVAALVVSVKKLAGVAPAYRPEAWDLGAAASLGVVLLGTLAALAALVATGAGLRWVREPDRRLTTLLAALLYASLMALLFILPNQGHIGLPFPKDFTHWDHATNHARYSTPFFPFAVAAVVWLASLLPGPKPVRWVALALVVLAWNRAYATGFLAPGAGRCDAGAAAGRNTRPYRALEAEAARGLAGPVHYLPIPRDHGDHYLLRAVLPDAPYRSACAGRAESGVLLVSRQTACVTYGTGIPKLPFEGARTLEDPSWEIQLVDVKRLQPDALARWCEMARAGPVEPGAFGPEPGAPGPPSR